jgi:hypothetical protein
VNNCIVIEQTIVTDHEVTREEVDELCTAFLEMVSDFGCQTGGTFKIVSEFDNEEVARLAI